MLMKACMTIQNITPTTMLRLKGSVWRRTIAKSTSPMAKNSRITAPAPTSPSSSPMTANMKSFSTSGIQLHLSLDLPKPVPKIPPEARAQVPCSNCHLTPMGSAPSGLSQASKRIRLEGDAMIIAAAAARPANPSSSQLCQRIPANR